MNKHGVSGRCFAETNVKYFKSDAKDIAEKKCTFYGKLKNFFMCILEILPIDKKNSFLKCGFLCTYFSSKILLIDLNIFTLKMDFFKGIKICGNNFIKILLTVVIVRQQQRKF